MIGFNWLFGGRATTDDTEELIHLENLNQNTIRTATQTLGQVNRLTIEKEGLHNRDERLRRVARENWSLRVRVHELELQLYTHQSALAGAANVDKMEDLLGTSVLKELVAYRVGQQTVPGFHQRCRELDLSSDPAFIGEVDQVVARRLASLKERGIATQGGKPIPPEPINYVEGMSEDKSRRQLRRIYADNKALRARIEELESQDLSPPKRASGSDLMRVVKIEGLVRESVSRELTAHHLGRQFDEGFIQRCRDMEGSLEQAAGVSDELAHEVAVRLGSVGMPNRRVGPKP